MKFLTVSLYSLLFSSLAYGALAPECGSAPPNLEKIDLPAAVSFSDSNNHRLFIYQKPQQCPKKGACPWKSKGFLVDGDHVQELMKTGDFSCVLYTTPSGAANAGKMVVGWVNSSDLCLQPLPRKNRTDPLDYPKGHKPCTEMTRTIGSDAAFYSGIFTDGVKSITTKYTSGREIDFNFEIKSPECILKITDKAYIERDSRAIFKNAKGDRTKCAMTFAFTDSHLELSLYKCAKRKCNSGKIVLEEKH